MRAYGWKSDKIHVVPEEATVLRRAADLVLAGQSVRAVAEQLEDEGIVGAQGKPLQDVTIGRALRNPRICGQREAHGRLYPTEVEPILTPEKYKRVRRVIESRSPEPTKVHLLAGGRSVCRECGRILYVSKQSGGAFAYGCAVRSGGCGGVWISASLLEEYVTNELIARIVELVPSLDPGRLLIMWAGLSPARRREIVDNLITSVSVAKSLRRTRVGLDPDRVSIEWDPIETPIDVGLDAAGRIAAMLDLEL